MKSKRERFEEIASNRIIKILDDLESLAKCSNPRNYEYTQQDVKKMMSALRKKLKSVEDKFQGNKTNGQHTFKF